jgi:TonB family protein
MTTFTRDELALYVMGEHDDPGAVEAALATDDELRAAVTDEARFEVLLREAAVAATFCPGCGDPVSGARCDACGVAIAPGGYVVERVLVAGPHGRMYVARDADGKQVALKELAFVHSPTLEMIAAFEREAKFLRALDHPAIPRFVASFEEGSGVHVRYYLAQELVAGQQLDARLADHFYREPEVIAIARQVLDVLVYLQSLSPMVIHRDIKPANLLRRADGTIAVVDFGAAHVQGTTVGSSSLGTFGYMPIEQLAGLVDATTDPYALGASLLHLLTRREPWRLLLGAQLDELNVSRGMRAFLGKLVAPDPKDRFSTARAALDALERTEKGQIMKVAERPSWHKPTMVAAASALVIAAGIGGAAMYGGGDDPERPKPAPVVASGDLVEREITELTALVDDACRCRIGDRACGQRAMDAINRRDEREQPTPDPGQKLRIQEITKRGFECLRKAMTEPATVQVMLPPGVVGELWLDGEKLVPAIGRGHQQTIASGKHLLEVVVADGRRCEQGFTLAAGSRLTVECNPVAVPPRLHTVPPSALAHRPKQIVPDDATAGAIAKSGKRVIGSYKLCLDERGKVSEVKKLKSTGYPAYDATIEATMKTWTFEPFAPGGAPTPVCTAYTFVYEAGLDNPNVP